MAMPESTAPLNGQVQVEASKYANPAQEMASTVGETVSSAVGHAATAVATTTQNAVDAVEEVVGGKPSMEVLATVDDSLSDLPGGYGESRIVLLPRDPQWGLCLLGYS